MKKNITLCLGASFLCGLFVILGSILGHAVSQTALLIGAFVGGVFGVFVSALFFFKTKSR